MAEVATETLIWERDGRDWPGREASRFVSAAGISWHVQQFGEGPPALLLHGTGASAHSWAFLAPHLSARFRLIALDLPSHGFTAPLPAAQMSLPGIALAVSALLAALKLRPALAIGHSAGAAILARMALDRLIEPRLIVAINGALLPFPCAASHLFPAMAKLLFVNPFASRFFAWRAAQAGAVERLIEGTGSRVPAESLMVYERLFRSRTHIAGTLAMMANWDLPGLAADLPGLAAPFLHIVGSGDRAVPPDQAFQLARRMPRAKVELLRGPGHLAHEEAPALVGERILAAAAASGLAGAEALAAAGP
jgi:magnesium chelatase accessory protein